MAEYIDRENYCKNICRCSREKCDKAKCPLWTAPAADVREVVRGEWVPCYEMQNVLRDDCTITGEKIFVGYMCSVCGRMERRMEPFCNCGADMREKMEK